ncbi:MAG: 50S ribosomal protein L21e [Candidatus Thermoplasmatota archaeon]|nr:50S ribosomal protein L21e [Candidatus Thermoplasmatota archaeon]
MVIRSKGIRSKSRKLLTKKPRQRGIHSITKALQQFDIGASVSIVIDPAVHKGMPHIRYQGYTGKVEGKQGSSYLVGIFDGKKHKTLIARPEHLRRVQ